MSRFHFVTSTQKMCLEYHIRSRTINSKLFWISFFTIIPFNTTLATELDDYVKKPDSSYTWKLEKTIENEDYNTFIIRLTSQTWRTTKEVSSPLWQHWLTIVRPKQIQFNKALIYVGSGSSKDPLPDHAETKWIEIAKNTKSVVAELKNVPNQPLVYLNDGEERYEDNSVAYTWDKFMATRDPTWSIRLPMVKSVVRALDTIQAFMESSEGGKVKIDEFVIAGASKRGWTTWLTAAVDKRVIAIIPMVIDVLNVQKFLKHHFSAYGFWAPAIKDYKNHHILERYQSSDFTKLMELEDPYYYRNRIKVPKYLINATGDQFFLPDFSRFYFRDLEGESYLRYIPNTNHSMIDSDAYQTLGAFYSYLVRKTPLPRFSWTRKQDGSLEVKVLDKPQSVKLWSAVNPKARDFRLDTLGKAFTSTPLKDLGNGTYTGKINAPQEGFAAFFIELTYPGNYVVPLKLSTEVSIVPDRLPFSDKNP